MYNVLRTGCHRIHTDRD